jgi:hypothetical protein
MRKSQLRKLAAEHGLSRKQLTKELAAGNIQVVEEGAAFSAAPDEDRRARKAVKLRKWSERLAAFGLDYKSLSRAERREARARWRADRALVRLAKVIGGSAQGDRDSAASAPVGDWVTTRSGNRIWLERKG